MFFSDTKSLGKRGLPFFKALNALIASSLTTLKGINLLREYFKSIGMPITLKEVEISQQDVSKIVDLMTDNGALMIGQKSIDPLNKEEIIKLLLSAL